MNFEKLWAKQIDAITAQPDYQTKCSRIRSVTRRQTSHRPCQPRVRLRQKNLTLLVVSTYDLSIQLHSTLYNFSCSYSAIN